jgi:hypothetical protein
MSECNSATLNLAVPEPNCLGKDDPIMMMEIDEDPYCLNNRCYEKSTLMQLDNGQDPYTRAVFRFDEQDDFQPPNPEAILNLQSRQWTYAPTVQAVLEMAENELNFPVPRANEPYQGSLLQLRDSALRSWIWNLLDAVNNFFPLDSGMSEGDITAEQKQAFLELADDLIHNRVPYSVINMFQLPPFPDPDQMLIDAEDEENAEIENAFQNYATQPLNRDSTGRAYNPSSPNLSPMPSASNMDLDEAEADAELASYEISQNLDSPREEMDVDPLAQFDSFFESDDDDESPRRRRRNQSLEPLP